MIEERRNRWAILAIILILILVSDVTSTPGPSFKFTHAYVEWYDEGQGEWVSVHYDFGDKWWKDEEEHIILTSIEIREGTSFYLGAHIENQGDEVGTSAFITTYVSNVFHEATYPDHAIGYTKEWREEVTMPGSSRMLHFKTCWMKDSNCLNPDEIFDTIDITPLLSSECIQHFKVVDEAGNPIKGALIYQEGIALAETGEEGKASVSLVSGTGFEVMSVKTGYECLDSECKHTIESACEPEITLTLVLKAYETDIPLKAHVIDEDASVKIHVIDETPWLDWLPLQEDEIEFYVAFTNTEGADDFQVQIWEATNSSMVFWGVKWWLVEFGEHACAPGNDLTICDIVTVLPPPLTIPGGTLMCDFTMQEFNKFLVDTFNKKLPDVGIRTKCSWENMNSGNSEVFHYHTDWRLTAISDFKGIPIIKIYKADGDKNNPKLIKEKAVPTYYEELAILNESSDNKEVSDPFGYAHRLVLDENCTVVGGDFCTPTILPSDIMEVCTVAPGGYGTYARLELDPETDIVSLGLDAALMAVILPVLELLPTKQRMDIPLLICEKEGENVYGIVDGSVWFHINGMKTPEGYTMHYLLNMEEYTVYDSKTCEDEDYTIKTILHQTQYKTLSETFFKDEELYKKLDRWYEGLTGKLNSTGEERSEAMASQIYCFKTHLKNTSTCKAINYGWYTLTDMHDMGASPSSALYEHNIRRWNCDALFMDEMPEICMV